MDAPPVQYVTCGDGYSIAYTVTGEGPPLVVWSGGFDSANFTARYHSDWLAGLAARFRVIYVDTRGSGLSQRGLQDDLSLADFDRDVEAVAKRFPGQRLAFFVRGMNGHPIIRFAAMHPDRVRAIVWWAANMRGEDWPLVHFGSLSPENWSILLDSMAARGQGGAGRRELRDAMAANLELEDLRIAVRVMSVSSVEDELAHLSVPLLVMHPRDLVALAPAASMRVAATAPSARFVLLDGAESYSRQEIAVIDDFLTALASELIEQPPSGPRQNLSAREIDVLRLLAAGKSNQQIADELVISLNTVRRHVSNVFDKTGVANRTEASVYARDHGLV